MLKKDTPVIQVVETPEPVTPVETKPTVDELERLRDILFGSQSRTMEKRLGDLETGLVTVRREAADSLTEKFDSLSASASSQVAELRREVGEKIGSQGAGQTADLRAMQKEWNERLDKQSADQGAQLRAAQKELSEGLDKLSADLLRQIRETHKELSDRMEKMNADQAERMRNLQAETRQRDDSLRQEILSLAGSLDTKKTSRHELGQMLVELGLRVRGESNSNS